MRRILQAGLGLLVIAVIGAAALWLARIPIATHLLSDRLERAGFVDARFEIVTLGWDHLRIAPLELGESPAPTIERVSIRFRPLQLLRGDMRHLEVSLRGVRAQLAASGGPLRIAGLPERAAADGEGGGGPDGAGGLVSALGALPTVHLRDAQLAYESGIGRWVTTLDADIESGPGGPVSARVDAGIVNNRLRIEGSASARYDGSRIVGSAQLRENDGFAVTVEGRVAEPTGAARGRVDYAIDMPARADLPWPFLPGASPSAGRVRIEGSAAGRMPRDGVPARAVGWIDALAAGDWSGDYRVEASDLAMNARFEGFDFTGRGQWRAADGRVSLSTPGEGALRIQRIAESLWSRLAPPAEAEPYVVGPVEVRWESGNWLELAPAANGEDLELVGLPRLAFAWPERPGTADLQTRVRAVITADGAIRTLDVTNAAVHASGLRLGDLGVERVALVGELHDVLGGPSGQWDLSIDLPRLARSGLEADDAALRLPFRVTSEEGVIGLDLREPGRVRAERLLLPHGLRSTEGIAATITDAAVRFDDVAGYSIALETERLRLSGAPERVGEVRVGTADVTVRGSFSAGAVTDVRLSGLAGDLPKIDLQAEGIEARLRPMAVAEWLDFSIGRVRQGGEAPLVAPVSVSGTVARRPDGLILDGQGRLADGAIPFRLDGRATRDASVGRVSLEVPRTRFRPDGVQPADAVPALRSITDVQGHAGGGARINWGAGEIDGSATVTLEDLDLRRGLVRIAGLAGELRLDRLRPARTAEPQRLTADHIDAGVRIESPSLEFAVERSAGTGPGVHVIEARGGVVDGTVAVRDWRFDPFAQVYDPLVEVENVSLAQLLDRLRVEGLEGSGRLSGGLPVLYTEEGLAIRGGRLRSLDGRVRYRSERATELLADTDRTVELMLRALRDFEYDQLEAEINREIDGASRIDIRMQGRNPDVLEGHPFDFNIALTGDVEPLLDALARGQQLTDELIERSLRLEQGR